MKFLKTYSRNRNNLIGLKFNRYASPIAIFENRYDRKILARKGAASDLLHGQLCGAARPCLNK